MQTRLDEILDAALQLSDSERLVMVHRLMDTLPESPPFDDDPEFLAELERRANDGSPGIPASELWTAELDD